MTATSKACFAALLLLGLATLSHASESARETFTFELPVPQPDPEPTATRTMGHVPVVWALEAVGDWPLDAEGEGVAWLMGPHIEASLTIDEASPPLMFTTLGGPRDQDGVTHVAFSQLGGRNTAPTALGAGGPNYLTSRGRALRSLGDDRGMLLNEAGFARIENNASGLAIQFSAQAVRCLSVNEPPFESTPPCDQSHQLSARPDGHASVHGWICERSRWEADPESCEIPFRIDAVTPSPDRENVNYNDPGISITFSEPVDMDSLEDSFELYTRARTGQRLNVDGRWEEDDGPSQYRFIPEGGFELRSGIILEARVEGGSEGVLSLNRSRSLDWDEVWRFSTLLNMAEGDNPQNFELELETFQVVRDAPLTSGKPTLSRIYLDWDLHNDIAEDWQPESYPIRFDLEPFHPRLVGQFDLPPREQNVARIYRDEEFNDTHRRFAHHTVNFFGWEPEHEAASLELELSHHDPFPGPSPQDERDLTTEAEIWAHDPAPLGIVYSIALVGSWSDGIPDEEFSRINTTLQQAAVMVPQFFPYREAQLRPAGFNIVQRNASGPHEVRVEDLKFGYRASDDETAPPGLVEMAMQNDEVLKFLGWDVVPEDERVYTPPAEVHVEDVNAQMVNLLQDVLRSERLRSWLNPNDAYLVFVPPDFMDPAGMAMGALVRGKNTNDLSNIFNVPGTRVALVVATAEDWLDTDRMTQVLLHELGHEHSLRHNPGNAGPHLPEGARYVTDFGIEAWRMNPDGLSGHNKSSTEGNAQHPNLMVSMMWPYVIETAEMSVTTSEYHILAESISGGTDSPLLNFDVSQVWPQSYRVATGPQSVLIDMPQPPSENIGITGSIAPSGLAGEIQSLGLTTRLGSSGADGSYRLEVRSASGIVLYAAAFDTEQPRFPTIRPSHRADPDEEPDLARLPGGQFFVSVPHDPLAKTLVVLAADGTEITRRDAPETRPAFARRPQILAEDENDILLGWRMEDDDGVAFDISYSTTGVAPWNTIYSGHGRNAAIIPRAMLGQGGNPTLRVTAHDGFNFTSATAALETSLVQAPEIVALPDNAAFAEGEPLTLSFPSTVHADTLRQAIRVIDGTGEVIETELFLNPVNQWVSVFAPISLEGERALILEVDSTLTDIYGSQIGQGFRRPLPEVPLASE